MESSSKSQVVVHKANLQRCGALITETHMILHEYKNLNDWKKLKQKVIAENILNKKSSTTINGILGCIKNRYKDSNNLPDIEELSHFISSDIPDKAKVHVLLPYICSNDSLIDQYILNMVSPYFYNLNKPNITKETFLEFLEEEKKTHPELDKWSDYLKKRWIRGLMSLLRNFDLMEAQPSFKLNKPSLRIETFAFFCLWFIINGKSGREVIESRIWKYYFLSNSEIEKLLEEAQRKGWLMYTRSGDIISMSSEFKSLEDWINGFK